MIAALAGCQDRSQGDQAFGRRVRAYLLSHPEVLEEASEQLDARRVKAEEASRKQAQSALPRLRTKIERDPQDFVANPAGAITVTEFYDYRCPHCANAAPKVVELVRNHPEIRFVFKEMPIFGRVSQHAARAALAVRRAGGDSLGLYQAYMSTSGLDDRTIDRLALEKGAKPTDLTPAALSQADAHLARTAALFTELDLEGTPAFIVGDQIILGEDLAAVSAAIDQQRTHRG